MKIRYEVPSKEIADLMWHILTKTKPIKYIMIANFILLSAILTGGIAYVLSTLFALHWTIAVIISVAAVMTANLISLILARKMTSFSFRPFYSGTKFAGVKELNVTEEGLRQEGSDTTTVYQWKAISSVQQTGKYIFVFSRHEPIAFIPRRAFGSQEEERTFLETIARLSGKKIGAVSADQVGPIKRMIAVLAAIAVLATLLFSAYSTIRRNVPVSGIDIIGYGIFETNFTGKREAKDTSLGSIRVSCKANVIQETDRIHGILGTAFGVKYKVKSEKKWGRAHLQVKVIHPETVNPDTHATATLDAWHKSVSVNRITGDFWIFEHDWEIVPGTWTFQIWQRNKLLAEKSFEVLKRR